MVLKTSAGRARSTAQPEISVGDHDSMDEEVNEEEAGGGSNESTIKDKKSPASQSTAIDHDSRSPPNLVPPSTPVKHNRSASSLLSAPSALIKRQRLNNSKAAMSTLTKPFRSPLLARRGDDAAPRPEKPTSTPPVTPSKTTGNSSLQLPKTQNFRTSRSRHSNLTPPDPEINTLQAHLTTLRTRLKAAQTYLSMSQQALALESLPSTHKDSDERLEELIFKWRAAARQAADYLFGVAVDRVNRMGGARAYFAREKERRTKWDGGEADNSIGGDWARADDGEEIDPVAIEEQKRQLMAEYDLEEVPTNSRSQKEIDIAQTDDDHFTMEMMLKTMNIDFELIGFDPDRQCWTD